MKNSLSLPLLLLVLAGSAYHLYAAWSVRGFFRHGRHRPDPKRSLPPVSVLKPVKGIDPGLIENIASFCRQDYPEYEVLLGFSDPGDPGINRLRKALSADGRLRIVVTPEQIGANGKVSNLAGLGRAARYPLLAVSDADMRVEPGYLRGIVDEYLAGENVGLVTSLYKIPEPRSAGTALESLTIALDFLPSVLVAQRLEGVTFGLGASMLFSKQALQEIGGFPALAGYLADDYQLGNRISRKGHAIVLSGAVIEDVAGRMSMRDFLSHQLRWARTYRASRPAGFAGYGITHSTFAALLLLALEGPSALPLAAAAAALGSRLAVASAVYGNVIKKKTWLKWLPLLPVKDVLGFALWAWSFAGNSVSWRGRTYRITKEGKMMEERRSGVLNNILTRTSRNPKTSLAEHAEGAKEAICKSGS